MEENTPYQPPTSSQIQELQNHTDLITEELRKTKPWVIFLSIVGFIVAVLCLVTGGFLVVLSAMGINSFGGDDMGLAIGIGVGVLYAVMGVLYFFPSFRLLKYGTAIGRFQRTQSGDDLLAAITQQRSFWRFIGISFIVLIIFYILLFVVMIGFGAFAGMRNM